MRATLALLVAAPLSLLGCVDTELGLDARIQSASLTVTGAAVEASLDVHYRVGPHAQEAHAFQPQAIELFVGDTQVAQLSPQTSSGSAGSLDPGQSADITLSGQKDGVTEASRLCGADVRVLLRWLDSSPGSPGAPTVGMTDATTMDVTCR